MRTSAAVLGVVFALALALVLYKNLKQGLPAKASHAQATAEDSSSPEIAAESQDDANNSYDTDAAAPSARQTQSPLTSEETQSLNKISRLVSAAVATKADRAKLVNSLKAVGLTPDENSNSNPATGKMTIVRTKNTLSGTRYFHAQIFEDQNKKEFIQHVSFELRPGPDSFAKAQEIVKASLPAHNHLIVNDPDFKQWRTEDGYTTWIKIMKAEDLRHDPFNAYSAEDIGTVRIVTELEVEDHEDGHGH